jgi:hypothetical protein
MTTFHDSEHLDYTVNAYLINENALKILHLLFSDVETNIFKAILYL